MCRTPAACGTLSAFPPRTLPDGAVTSWEEPPVQRGPWCQVLFRTHYRRTVRAHDFRKMEAGPTPSETHTARVSSAVAHSRGL